MHALTPYLATHIDLTANDKLFYHTLAKMILVSTYFATIIKIAFYSFIVGRILARTVYKEKRRDSERPTIKVLIMHFNDYNILDVDA